ncbi:unnamed protein product [Vicia faba]|uniref:Uncharacterized protein n=1 Tax=Vicia faba TaxID=3906 RepID=A0AAV0ZE59_VICFA|nr:unnamed protein product [Vicia faba]
MVSLILVEIHPPIRSSPIKDVDRSSTSNIFLCLPREILENIHSHIMHYIMTGFPLSGFLILLLFISVEMALERTVKDIQAQNAQLQEMFLNLSKGQEEVKALLTRGMVLGNPGGIRNDQLEGLQIELATMKIQMMGQLVGQMSLIQNLAQGQEKLKVLINKLLQDGCNQVGQTTRVENQVIIQPPLRQEAKGKSPQCASGSQAQQQPR